MTSAQYDTRISRPIDDVFDFLSDGTNNPRWQRLVVQTVGPAGPIGVDSVFDQRVRHPLGFTASADYRITGDDRPRCLALAVVSGGGIRPTVTYDLTPIDDEATTVRCRIEYYPNGFARLASPALALLHPLFAWQASSISRASQLLESAKPQTD